MKNSSIYCITFISILLLSCNSKQKNETVTENIITTVKRNTDTLIKIKGDSSKGFNFDYLLYLPKDLANDKAMHLLVESTNTGLNDSIEYHEKGAKHAASRSSVGNYVSKKLEIPLLVPVFPRSKTNWQLYTHALDKETFNAEETEIERLDLQLLRMVEDAKKQLNKKDIQIKERFFMTGFSASGTFANRFSILHPDKIKAVCGGGFNGILIVPQTELNGKPLNFPIGIADVEKVTGTKVDMENFRKLSQFWYMGENDNNDAAKFDDAYHTDERALIYSELGEEMMPSRWENVQGIYNKNKINAIFKTYKGIGHGTDLKMNDEISDFFRKHQ